MLVGEYIALLKRDLETFYTNPRVIVQVSVISTGQGVTDVSIQRLCTINEQREWETLYFDRRLVNVSIFDNFLQLVPRLRFGHNLALDYYVRSNVLIVIAVACPE